MRIWIRSNRDIVFKLTSKDSYGYALLKDYCIPVINNKRSKIREEGVICLASRLYINFPPGFTLYSTEDIKYWHELRRLIKAVCV